MIAPPTDRPVVLVVDDEALLRLDAAGFLEDAGFATLEAADGLGALATVAAHPEISVLFTDVTMPGPFDGVELVRRVHACRPDVRLIVTSGRPAPARGALPPAAAFIAKPYDCRAVASLAWEGGPASPHPAAEPTALPVTTASR